MPHFYIALAIIIVLVIYTFVAAGLDLNATAYASIDTISSPATVKLEKTLFLCWLT